MYELAGVGDAHGPVDIQPVVLGVVLGSPPVAASITTKSSFSEMTFTPDRVSKPAFPLVAGKVRMTFPFFLTLRTCFVGVVDGHHRVTSFGR